MAYEGLQEFRRELIRSSDRVQGPALIQALLKEEAKYASQFGDHTARLKLVSHFSGSEYLTSIVDMCHRSDIKNAKCCMGDLEVVRDNFERAGFYCFTGASANGRYIQIQW